MWPCPTRVRASLPFDLEALRATPELLAEFERVVAHWSVAAPDDSPFVWPAAVDAPAELKAFYAIAHAWPGARLYGSQDFLRPLDRLARDGGKLTIITENQGNFRIALESIAGRLDAVGLHVRADLPVGPDGRRQPVGSAGDVRDCRS